jgi:hypothetical protein
MLKKGFFCTLTLIVGIILVFSSIACDDIFGDDNNDGNNSGNGGGGGGGSGTSQSNAIPVIVGYSSSHTISSNGQHWFKFIGTGDPVIFETRGNVVDTYIDVDYTTMYFYPRSNNNSGEGSNALLSFSAVSGEMYYVKITPRSSTSGTYAFLVE